MYSCIQKAAFVAYQPTLAGERWFNRCGLIQNIQSNGSLSFIVSRSVDDGRMPFAIMRSHVLIHRPTLKDELHEKLALLKSWPSEQIVESFNKQCNLGFVGVYAQAVSASLAKE